MPGLHHKQHPVLTRKDYMGAFELCQPADTRVLTPSGSVAISSLVDGDRVVGADPSNTRCVQPRQGVEVAVATRDYNGELIGVVVDSKTTWCTAGHLWTVRLAPDSDRIWTTYLMRRGRWWRVGKTQMLTTWGLGLKQRLLKEGADEAWILSVHRSNAEATLLEQVIAVRYGIPTTYWTETYGVTRSKNRSRSDIEGMYERLDVQEMQRSAMQLLTDYNRLPQYPFVTRGQTRPKYGRRVNLSVRACNLLEGAMVVPHRRRRDELAWSVIRAIDHQSFDGRVYSLDVPNGRHYIADDIVTHNCFYGWREGAGHHFFGPNNATDLWHVKKVNPASMIHLTEKPVELAVRAIQYSSRPGENVLDLFGGSGSTLIACEQTDRHSFLMEIDPAYCDVIVQRWEQFTARTAERIASDTSAEAGENAPANAEACEVENV